MMLRLCLAAVLAMGVALESDQNALAAKKLAPEAVPKHAILLSTGCSSSSWIDTFARQLAEQHGLDISRPCGKNELGNNELVKCLGLDTSVRRPAPHIAPLSVRRLNTPFRVPCVCDCPGATR